MNVEGGAVTLQSIMKQLLTTRLMVAVIALLTISCSNDKVQAQTSSDMKINITIGDQTRTATLVFNSSTEALVAALQEAPITYEAHDYGYFEKVGDLGRSFPQNNTSITTEPGDLILYQGNNLCIYYDTNSWNFTRLGRIDDATQNDIKQFVRAGQGNVTVTLSIADATEIKSVSATRKDGKIYALNGSNLKQEPTKGIYIKDSKKIIK